MSPHNIPSTSKYPEQWDDTPMPGPRLQLQMQNLDFSHTRSRTLSPSVLPAISNLVEPPVVHPVASCPPTIGTVLPGSQPPHVRPRPRMRPVPGSNAAESLQVAHGHSPFRRPSQWFQLPVTPDARLSSSPEWILPSPSHLPQRAWQLPQPDSPSPVTGPLTRLLQPQLAYVPPTGSPVTRVAHPAAPPSLNMPMPPVPDVSPKVVAPATATGLRDQRDGTPSTVIASDTESVRQTPTGAVPGSSSKAKGKRTLRRYNALSEAEILRLLSGTRKCKGYQPYEDLRLVQYVTDPQHPRRVASAQSKVKKGVVPKVFEQASTESFRGSRSPESLHERWKALKKMFAVVHKLENASGGNGDADYANDDPNQPLLEKLGAKLQKASKHMSLEDMTAEEYLFWVEDPVGGLYALLADMLSNDVSVVRQHQFRSGAISPLLCSPSGPVIELEDDSSSVVVLDEDPAVAPTSHSGAAQSSGPQEGPQRSRKAKADDSEFTVASGLAFIRETQTYHANRAETDRRRLELETNRFKLEQANGDRAEQRLKLDERRIELAQAEQTHLASVAHDSHQLEVARLDLARDRNQDLKRKAEMDELDRLRTHKRLRAETITNTALQIQADKDNRFSQQLKDASQEHILAMFAQARDFN